MPPPQPTNSGKPCETCSTTLKEAGMNEVVATNVYLSDVSDLRAFDEVYVQYFSDVLPARATIEQIASAKRTPDKEDHYPH